MKFLVRTNLGSILCLLLLSQYIITTKLTIQTNKFQKVQTKGGELKFYCDKEEEGIFRIPAFLIGFLSRITMTFEDSVTYTVLQQLKIPQMNDKCVNLLTDQYKFTLETIKNEDMSKFEEAKDKFVGLEQEIIDQGLNEKKKK
jgi:hypothetical protein